MCIAEIGELDEFTKQYCYCKEYVSSSQVDHSQITGNDVRTQGEGTQPSKSQGEKRKDSEKSEKSPVDDNRDQTPSPVSFSLLSQDKHDAFVKGMGFKKVKTRCPVCYVSQECDREMERRLQGLKQEMKELKSNRITRFLVDNHVEKADGEV